MLLRLLLSTALTADDAREAVLAQSLQWGYQARQPPLYNWLAGRAFRLARPRPPRADAPQVRGRSSSPSARVPGRAPGPDGSASRHLRRFSFLLIVPISWTIHEALTHSVTVIAACAGTVYALLRLDAAPGPRAYAGLGLAVGLGLLSKFTYVLFLVALVLAALTLERFRARLLRPAILITALVAIASSPPSPSGSRARATTSRGCTPERSGSRTRDDSAAGPARASPTCARIALTTSGRWAGPGRVFPRSYRRLPAGARAAPPTAGSSDRFLAAVFLLLSGRARRRPGFPEVPLADPRVLPRPALRLLAARTRRRAGTRLTASSRC